MSGRPMSPLPLSSATASMSFATMRGKGLEGGPGAGSGMNSGLVAGLGGVGGLEKVQAMLVQVRSLDRVHKQCPLDRNTRR